MSNLKSLVEVKRRFQRSVNINSDISSGKDSLEGYQLLTSGVNVLNNIAEHISQTNQRAFTITGAFGSGKSALGLYLCCLASRTEAIKKQALAKLERYSEYSEIKSVFSDRRYDLHVLTGRQGSIEDDLNNSLFGSSATGSLIENIESFNKSKKKDKLVILDEMGRYLSENLFDNCAALQNFAEAINQEGSKIVFIGILHQNFTAYAQLSPEVHKLEWQKVQGRFLDTPLVSHSEETLKMLSSALALVSPNSGNRAYSDKSINSTLKFLSSQRKIDKKKYLQTFRESWPLNPVVCLILGPIAKRGFWQNNRSVFNFLTSQEPFGFQDFLGTTSQDSPDLYGPVELWNYLEANYGFIIASDSTERRNWSVALDCIARTEALDQKNAVNLVKAISLLFIFAGTSGIKPSLLVLKASFPQLEEQEISSLLELLKERKIIVEKRHSESFSLFEGSDFDFDQSYEKVSIAEINPTVANELVNLPVLVARRNYVKTGNLHWFPCRLADAATVSDELEAPAKGASGKLIFWLGQGSEDEIKRSLRSVKEGTTGINLIGIPSNKDEILSMSIETQRINQLRQEPALEGDRIARLEVDAIFNSAKERLNSLIDKAFDNSKWYIGGEYLRTVKDVTELNKLLSDLCDEHYKFALALNNELINREELSPNIKTARKNLIHRMLAHEGEDDLGFEGMPAEAMIFLSLFKEKGLHVRNSHDRFSFALPQECVSLNELWKTSSEFLSASNPVELTSLYSLWGQEPFGIKKGLMPVLLFFFYCLNKNSLTFYIENNYQAEITTELIELLLARPELIQIKNYISNAKDSDITNALFEYLQKCDKTLTDKTPLAVARALVKKVFLLPKWLFSTSRASAESKKFCEVVLRASDPIELLFNSIPELLNARTSKELLPKIIGCFNELELLTNSLYEEIKILLLKELDASNAEEVKARSSFVKNRSGNLQLEGFINTISSIAQNEDECIEKLLSFVTGKQKGRWNDSDLIRAKTVISDLAFKFRHLEALSAGNLEEPGRKLLGIVTAGVPGRKEWIVDISSEQSSRVSALIPKIDVLLQGLSKEEAIALLIDSISKAGEKNGN
ncbi:hypothetical protein [Parasutterella muris]|uniref:hypothetical protein n=2 Tax=Parasutterella TaxID=577310 RepID=UPI00203BB480|nr:hypothetical protein [Parasutterella muris]